MISRRQILKWFASLLAILTTPLAGSLIPPRTSSSPVLEEGGPAIPLIGYEDTIILNQRRKRGDRSPPVIITGPKFIFDSKNYGVIAIDSSKRRRHG
jgi:hypothetical protein